MKPTAISAVNSGVAAFRSAVKPAGSVRVANEISVNGTAENSAPTRKNVATRPRATPRVWRPATTRSTAAPIVRRTSAAHTGPTSGDAIRRNRNAAPQTAPRNRSDPRSTIDRARRAAGWAVDIKTRVAPGDGPAHRRGSQPQGGRMTMSRVGGAARRRPSLDCSEEGGPWTSAISR
jgi:hypothetical protein